MEKVMDLIAAADCRWGIGKNGKLLWHIPEDLTRFRELTEGYAVAVGRNTLETFPGRGPLSGRKNYVLTHHPDDLPSGFVPLGSTEELLQRAKDEKIFLAGGASVYGPLLGYCRRAYITRIDADGAADAFCPNLDTALGWTLEFESALKTWNDLAYRFCVYVQGD